MRFQRTSAFWILAVILAALLFASSVPSPLYPVYQSEWGFSSITLTSVFAVYALALLGSLLVVGSISDHVGRRPTLLAGLALEIVAMVAFAEASGIGWLFAARTLQGIATGASMGAISAALLDLQPESKPWLGGLMSAVAPLTGLALGSLSAGAARRLRTGPHPVRLLVARWRVRARDSSDRLRPRDGGQGWRLVCIAAAALGCPAPPARRLHRSASLPGRCVGARRPRAVPGRLPYGWRPW
jgi:MFS family permease